MNTDKVVSNQDFRNMKNVDAKFGEQVKQKKVTTKTKEKHRVAYQNMSVEDVMAMNEENDLENDLEYDLEYDYA